MGFVLRNTDGAIVSWFACAQAFPTEQIADDDPAVIAFLNPTPPLPTVSDRQFFQQLAVQGVITQTEALAAVKTGDIPAALEAVIQALPAEQQFAATMLISGATAFDRYHPTTALLGAAMGWTSEQIDDLWINAGKL